MRLSPSGRIWLLALGGPLAWFAHLSVIYAAASLGVVARSDRAAVALAILLATLVAVALQGALILAAVRNRLPRLAQEPDEEAGRFWRATIGVGALIGLIAVLWQALAALIVR